ncbi:alpha/beta hydrolase family protein [Deinococcus misasensis]|uniref:alpha/beta hydrolase family protein n=1 Tax=Deinococcus misasensis TaxID=392413 RepID=UPI00068C0FD5|nr:dienelactone hydrolase [Deinococcus misasensis]
MNKTALVGAALALGSMAFAQQNRIDTIRPDSPQLSPYGEYQIGVQTLKVVNPKQLDIVNATAGNPIPTYDRPLTLEVWYPAQLKADQKPGGVYNTTTRDASIAIQVYGKAVRDAEPLVKPEKFPLVIVSHGYPGNRYLLSHLTENLASKGYVVVAIDHTDSTFSDVKAFGSTLMNRSLDQLFVLNEIDKLSKNGSKSFLSGLVDANNTAVVGYSMGGYGVVNTIGGGFTDFATTLQFAPPNKALAARAASNPDYLKTVDSRIKAAIAIAPWGMQVGFWNAETLKGIKTPVLFVAGDRDDVSGYEKGTRAIFENAVNTNRYLLTFHNANHNAAAPMPAPVETYNNFPLFEAYSETAWDTVKMNNILAHFATAYLGMHLKGQTDMQKYLNLVENSNDGAGNTYWEGFKPRTALGLSLKYLPAGK